MIHAHSTGRVALLFYLFCLPADAFAHARLLFPVPRTNQAEKTGPCGGRARGDEPLVLHIGEEITVEWEEFVDHPGYYQILFSLGGDADFIMILDQIPDRRMTSGTIPNHYQAAVRMPLTPCEEGTLQLIQAMTENPLAPRLYFSCADIRLVEAAPGEFRRGDANADGAVDVSDAIATLEKLFFGNGEIPCESAADSNDDDAVDISDAIVTLTYKFLGGEPPASPGPEKCGVDPTEENLACDSYPACKN